MMAKEGLLELWSLLVAGACLYLCSIFLGQLSPVPSDVSRVVPEDPFVHKIRRTLNVKEQNAQVHVARVEIPWSHENDTKNWLTNHVNQTTKTDTRLMLERFILVINQPYLCHQVDNDDVGTSVPSSGNHTDMSVYLLIIVHSHPANKRRRNAIRETWGRIVRRFDPDRQVVLVFMLGIPQDYDQYHNVQREARLYRDAVVYDFVDEYRNLTIKSLLGLYWVYTHCQKAKYVIKADDDVYLNVPFFLDELQKHKAKDLILGSLNPRSPVKRYGQWSVEYRDYPYQLFPPYCSGCTYAMSGDVARRLHHVSQGSQSPTLIPVEDVYVTGLLAERLGVRCRHHEQFPSWISVPSARYVQRFLTRDILGLHGVDWIRMHTMWQMIHKCPNCSTDIQQVQHWLSWLMDIDPMYR